MYDFRTVETLRKAVSDILLPKFGQYIEHKRNSSSLIPEIEQVISEIEAYEDFIEDKIMGSLPTDKLLNNVICIGGYSFTYKEEVDSFVFYGDKEQEAKWTVYRKHKLNDSYDSRTKINNRIAAIISTLEETSFDKVVEIVESQLNWDEFLA